MIAWIDMTLNIERKGFFKENIFPILNEISGSFHKNTLNAVYGHRPVRENRNFTQAV